MGVFVELTSPTFNHTLCRETRIILIVVGQKICNRSRVPLALGQVMV